MVKIKKYFFQNIEISLFLLFLFVYIFFGLFNFYFSNTVTDVSTDLIYSIDTGKVFWHLYLNDKFMSIKHPFIHFFTYPIILIFKIFFVNPKIVAVILQSLIQSFVVYLISKILIVLTDNKNIALIFGLIFGFSYTALLFAIYTDVYVWAGLTQMLFLYYIIKLYKNGNTKLNLKNIIILSVLTVFCYGINKINIVSCGILILFLLYITYKNRQKIFLDFVKISLTISCLLVLIINFQNLVFNKYSEDVAKGVQIIEFIYRNGKITETITGSLVEPFYALKSEVSSSVYMRKDRNNNILYINRWMLSPKQNSISYFPALLLLFIALINYNNNIKKYRHENLVNVLLFISWLYVFFNYSFYSFECTTFALNYFPYLIVLLGLIFNEIKSLYKYILLVLFLIFEVFINMYNLFMIHKFLNKLDYIPISFSSCTLYSACAVFFLYVTYNILKIVFKKNKFFIDIKDNYCFYISIYLSFLAIFSILKIFSYFLR